MLTNKHFSTPAALLAALLLTAALAGCGKQAAEPAPQPQNTQAAAPVETAQAPVPEAAPAAQRQDGERFEDVIVLEGMEETVKYEHVRNDALGFEMDYDYENFVRFSDTDCERFVSNWDDPASPENYLEIRYNPHDAQTLAASVSAALSLDYEISRDDAFPLERAGSCIRIDASAEAGGLTMPERLQMVYIIPAGDGCRIATAHYFIEGAEGFGRRFHYLMETFSAIPASGEKRLTDAQAVSAIRNYCLVGNPDLKDIVEAGEYPVYWDISSSDGNQIAVVFRSYTGALIHYYIDPVSGDTYVTEYVPGVMDAEQRTGESLNAWDYLF